MAVLHPPPVHVQDEPPLPEPLRPNPKLEELVASLMAADAERLQNPSLALSRVAYDAFDAIDLASNMFVREDCERQTTGRTPCSGHTWIASRPFLGRLR